MDGVSGDGGDTNEMRAWYLDLTSSALIDEPQHQDDEGANPITTLDETDDAATRRREPVRVYNPFGDVTPYTEITRRVFGFEDL